MFETFEMFELSEIFEMFEEKAAIRAGPCASLPYWPPGVGGWRSSGRRGRS
ncbi:hypothetical protein [Streptomyces sp. NPDC050504]|uniref:hypothetical protein n=1 Tax=Streptomyces sp. NPDC050504 TaxID=3365618 RepID=UPI0037B7BC34